MPEASSLGAHCRHGHGHRRRIAPRDLRAPVLDQPAGRGTGLDLAQVHGLVTRFAARRWLPPHPGAYWQRHRVRKLLADEFAEILGAHVPLVDGLIPQLASEQRAAPQRWSGWIGNMLHMADALVTDRKAAEAEIRAHAEGLHRLATDLGLPAPQLRDDGTVVIHPTDVGYRTANRFSSAASKLVGAYVHVITDDVPGASAARDL